MFREYSPSLPDDEGRRINGFGAILSRRVKFSRRMASWSAAGGPLKPSAISPIRDELVS